MSKVIRHTGVVDSVAPGSVVVRIVQSSACASCHAAHLCRSAEGKERLLTVQTVESAGFAVGQMVQVEGTTRTGLVAAGLAYVVPLVLVMASMMVATALGASEPVAALVALAALVPYGFVLWILRQTLTRRLAFSIIKS